MSFREKINKLKNDYVNCGGFRGRNFGKFKDINNYLLNGSKLTDCTTQQYMKILYDRGLSFEEHDPFDEFIDNRKLWWDHRWYIFYRLDLEEKMAKHVDKLTKIDQKLNDKLKTTDLKYNEAVSAMNKQVADQQEKTHIKISNYNIVVMHKSNLNKLTKSQLIDLLLKDQQKPIPKPSIESKKPLPKP